MKKVYDFVFAERDITPDTIFYSVAVGTSERDRRALAAIPARLPANSFLLALHHEHFCEWLRDLEAQFFGSCRFYSSTQVRYLRRKFVSVLWLASFLRKNPPALLNSKAIDTPSALFAPAGNDRFF